MWLNALLILAVFCGVGSCHNLGRITIDPAGHWFNDEHGRVVILRGVNNLEKGFPWYQPVMLEQWRMDDLNRFGYNVVRLGAMWTGAEPAMGQFNATYFQIEGEIVNKLADAGVYSFLDMHQDCMSSYFPPSYDGVPTWLIDLFPEPSEPYPYPLDEITAWEQGYLTQGVSEAAQQLYNNTEGALELWGRFWREMALEFKDNSAVLGYNYMNEPWVGDYLQDESLLLPGVAGRENLLPVWDYLTEIIREVDDIGLIFYEPAFHGQLFTGETIGSGYDRVPGGEGNEHLSAFSWHAYCWFLEFIDGDATDEEKEDAKERCEDWLLPTMFESAQKNVERTGGVSILTEYGICNGWDDMDYTPPWTECETFIDLADEYFESWTEWEYTGSWYAGGTVPKWGKILPHVRPYPRATSGEPVYNFFNRTSLEYNYVFRMDPAFDVPTEVFVPSLRYINGYDLEVSDNVEYEQAGDLLFLRPAETVTGPEEASITITPIGEGVNKNNFRKYYK